MGQLREDEKLHLELNTLRMAIAERKKNDRDYLNSSEFKQDEQSANMLAERYKQLIQRNILFG